MKSSNQLKRNKVLAESLLREVEQLERYSKRLSRGDSKQQQTAKRCRGTIIMLKAKIRSLSPTLAHFL